MIKEEFLTPTVKPVVMSYEISKTYEDHLGTKRDATIKLVIDNISKTYDICTKNGHKNFVFSNCDHKNINKALAITELITFAVNYAMEQLPSFQMVKEPLFIQEFNVK